ncbi:MAG TPA: hypothetical protein VIJ39_11390 [Solirubrobacteraceae bacterium]
MQLRLDLSESPVPVVALWELLGEEQRRAAMVLLSALIVRASVPEETDGERSGQVV